jgi:outer membrane lipoprotein
MQWGKKIAHWACPMLVTLVTIGCAHVISEPVRRQVDTTVSLNALRANPEAFKGRMVLLGGQIVQTSNSPEGSTLEVLHKPLDSADRPGVTDYSEGRFMALCERYLDPAVYARGRNVTIAGPVLGSRAGQIGEMQYTYPLMGCVELYLWPRVEALAPHYGVYPWWYWGPGYWDYWRWQHSPYPFWQPALPPWWW